LNAPPRKIFAPARRTAAAAARTCGSLSAEHGLARVPELAQQREVLHVARANLEDVTVLLDEGNLADVHHFGHERHVLGRRGLAQ